MKSNNPFVSLVITICAIIALLTFLPSIQAGNIANNVVAATNFLNSFGYWVLGGGSAIPGNIIPASDNTYDLGSSTAGWRNGYVTSNLTVNGTLYAKTGRAATYVIAASTAPTIVKAQADVVCDGVADEQDILAAVAAGYKHIRVSEGIVYLAADTTFSANVTFEGAGILSTTFVISVGAPISNLFYANGNGVTFRNFRITDNNSALAAGDNIIRFEGVNGGLVENVQVDTVTDQTISAIAYTGTSRNIKVSHCTFDAGGAVTSVSGVAPTVQDIRIENCQFLNGSSCGGSVNNYTITGNHIYDAGASGAIDIALTVGAIITGNILNGGKAIIYGQNSTGRIEVAHNMIVNSDQAAIEFIAPSGTTAELIIVDNYVYNCGTTTEAAIQVGREGGSWWNDSIVSRNTVIKSVGHGIIVQQSLRPQIHGNKVISSSQNASNIYIAILVDGTVTYPSIIGNQTVELETNKSKYGLYLTGAVSDAVVMGNSLQGGVTLNFRDDGTNNVVRSNKGYVTENSGSANITTLATAVDVTHGLAFTPTAKDISVTPASSMGAAATFWSGNYTASIFTIYVNAAPTTVNATFGWKGSRY